MSHFVNRSVGSIQL